jgi:3-oxoacyl-[acyl-carrier protein] reductase
MILKDKIAIVTGASTGIGRAIALGFAEEGANVVINYNRSEEAAKEVFRRSEEMGRKPLLVQGDMASEADVERLSSATMDAFGRIDILVNNAGLRTIVLCGVDLCPVLEMKIADWDRMIAVNLRGPFLMSKAVLPQMIKQKSGSIINISSGAGRKPVPGRSAYTASKHGLEGFTKALAVEVKDSHIRVNTLAPGGMTAVDARGGMPVGVIVPACIFLASDDSRDVSGESVIARIWNEERGIKIPA